MIILKKLSILILSVILAASFSGCDKKDGQKNTSSADSSTAQNADKSSEEKSEDDDDTSHEDGYISEKRKNTDYESLKTDAMALINDYYSGMEKENYDKFIGVFPDFYQKAFEDETKNEFNQTNDECITEMHDSFEITYGEDFYIVPEIIDSGILQLDDASLVELNKMIADTFDVNVNVTDAYSVNFQQITRGSKNRDSNPMEFLMIKIDDKFYLYDNWYTEKKGV